MKFLLLLLTLSGWACCHGQTTAKPVLPISANTASSNKASVEQAKNYYRLGIQYKDGKGVAMDYVKAYECFDKAAALGHPQSKYAKAYLLYKGLGCVQDYAQAASLFREGALSGRDNSMYFYALCRRNGYGIAQNEDSARYWLDKAAALGYQQAVQELAMKAPENGNDSAKLLVQRISNAALPEHYVPNTFNRIVPNLPAASLIAGSYTGYIIQYDWSGKHVVSTLPLCLTLEREGSGNAIKGDWLQANGDSVTIHASLKKDTLVFDGTRYRRKDHYSPNNAVLYNFQNAVLNLVQKGDSVFLAGSIQMFSPERKEPSKPLLVALARDKTVAYQDIGLELKAYPNPFKTVLNVQAKIPKRGQVSLELIGMDGVVAYRLNAGMVAEGAYFIPLQVERIAAGMYILRLTCKGGSAWVKVVKSGGHT